MNDKSLYSKILGIERPCVVSDILMDLSNGSVTIKVDHTANARLGCPVCGVTSPFHDHQVKRWHHLPTCHLRTIIEARTPRVKCPEHGVGLIEVPWAEGNNKFTALFEALVIGWLQEASITAVTRMMDVSWSQVDTIRR